MNTDKMVRVAVAQRSTAVTMLLLTLVVTSLPALILASTASPVQQLSVLTTSSKPTQRDGEVKKDTSEQKQLENVNVAQSTNIFKLYEEKCAAREETYLERLRATEGKMKAAEQCLNEKLKVAENTNKEKLEAAARQLELQSQICRLSLQAAVRNGTEDSLSREKELRINLSASLSTNAQLQSNLTASKHENTELRSQQGSLQEAKVNATALATKLQTQLRECGKQRVNESTILEQRLNSTLAELKNKSVELEKIKSGIVDPLKDPCPGTRLRKTAFIEQLGQVESLGNISYFISHNQMSFSATRELCRTLHLTPVETYTSEKFKLVDDLVRRLKPGYTYWLGLSSEGRTEATDLAWVGSGRLLSQSSVTPDWYGNSQPGKIVGYQCVMMCSYHTKQWCSSPCYTSTLAVCQSCLD